MGCRFYHKRLGSYHLQTSTRDLLCDIGAEWKSVLRPFHWCRGGPVISFVELSFFLDFPKSINENPLFP